MRTAIAINQVRAMTATKPSPAMPALRIWIQRPCGGAPQCGQVTAAVETGRSHSIQSVSDMGSLSSGGLPAGKGGRKRGYSAR